MKGHADIAQLLINYGADVNAEDKVSLVFLSSFSQPSLHKEIWLLLFCCFPFVYQRVCYVFLCVFICNNIIVELICTKIVCNAFSIVHLRLIYNTRRCSKRTEGRGPSVLYLLSSSFVLCLVF